MEPLRVQLMIYGGIYNMEEKSLTFEDAVKKLEEIVEKLEEEDVPLEKAIDYYQEGMKLSKLCDEKLQEAQEKVTKILNEHHEEEPFDIQEG